MTTTSQIVHAKIKKLRTFTCNGSTVYAFELSILDAVAGLERNGEYRMQVYPFYLAGRFMPARMAFVVEGDILSFELEGVSVSEGFIEFDRFIEFQVNTYKYETV